MRTNIASIVINIIGLLFLFATFLFQYEYLTITRMVLIIFSGLSLMLEIKKEYISSRKMFFIIFSAMTMLALMVSIYFEHATTNYRTFFIPVYTFILISIMYQDLYDERKNDVNHHSV